MSTGHPIKNSSDLNKVKQDYLETLRLQAKLNQQNLEANRLYLQTGQLPPSSQMTDTRSVEEKLMDVEYLKQRIISELSTISDPAFASNVVNAVLNSPLNIDNKLFRFLAQNITGFVEQLKKRYGIGIKGDANDVQVMVNFINTLFTDTQGSMQSVSDYAKSTTNLVNQKSNVLSVNDIDTMVLNIQEAIKRMRLLKDKIPTPNLQFHAVIMNKLNSLIEKLVDLRNKLPSSKNLELLLESISTNLDPEDIQLGQLRAIFDVLEKLPKPNIILTQLDLLRKAIDNNNMNVINDIVNRIYSYFSSFFDDPDVKSTLANWGIYFDDLETQQEKAQKELMKQYNIQQQQNIPNVNITATNVNLNSSNHSTGTLSDVSDLQNNIPSLIPINDAQQPPQNDLLPLIPFNDFEDTIDNMTRDELLELHEYFYRKNFFDKNEYELWKKKEAPLKNLKQHTKNVYRKHIYNEGTSLGMFGLGVKRKLKRGRGISTYKPLGGSLVNVDSLDKGLLTLRRQTKSNYPDVPSKRISPRLQGILQTIVGGGMPKFNDLNGLDDDEKDYLYKIMKKSNLTDKLSVPAPSKDQEEKDIHQFEVMKGQILSGNDSKDLVKRFKALMLKLVKKGLLPKNDVIELMDDLHTLGY